MIQNTKNTGMANYFKFISVLVFILSFVFSVGKADAQSTVTNLYRQSTPGTYTWTVPNGISQVKVKVWGAGGGGGLSDVSCSGFLFLSNCSNWGSIGGAGGGYAEAVINVTPGEIFDLTVGAGGFGVTNAPPTAFDTYNGNPNYTEKSAGSTILRSQTSGKYIGAGGGASGFSRPGSTIFHAWPPADLTSGSLHGKGDSQVVGGDGAGIAGKLTTWCGDANSNFRPECIVLPSGGNGFGDYPNITKVRGSYPPVPNPFPTQIWTSYGGGDGANGGTGGQVGQNGQTPGGAGGAIEVSSGVTKGGDGRVVIETIPTTTTTTTTASFSFAITNDGDKTVNIGDIVTNNINVEALSNIAGDVKLTLDSIKTSSGVNVMNTTNGFTVPANVFAPKTNTVSLASTGQKDITPLTLISSPTVSVGTYIAKISGTYTLTTPATPGGSTQYYCKMTLKANNRGYYFGCSPDSNFSPQADFISRLPTSVECIEGDTFGPEPSCTFGNGVLTIWAKDQIANHRLNYGSSVCSGSVSVSGDPNNPNTGFTCVVSPKPASTQTVVKSTTFNITTRVAPVVINYNLTLTPGIGGCLTPLYIGLQWNAIANATGYNLYRSVGGGAYQTINVWANPVNGKVSTTDNSDSYGSHDTLIIYKVAAIVNGVEIEQSPESFIFSPPMYPPESCVTFVPVVKLFAKKTTDGSINLASYTENSAVTPNLSLYKNETFDLKWASNLPSDYTCTQVTTMPNWSINNSIWNYGNPTNGSTAGLSVASLAPGSYNLRVSCTRGASTVSSNNIIVTVISEPVYNLSVTSSGDQCFSFDFWIRQTWTAIPGATGYRISRTSGSNTTYFIVPPTVTNLETHTMFAPGTPFTYTVTAVINGFDQTPSAPVSIVAPRVICPASTVTKLFIRNSNSVALNFGSYTTATALTGVNTTATAVNGLETFDLKWVSDLDKGYACSPTGTGSGLWSYGTTLAGAAYNLNTTGYAPGTYTFSIQCTKGASVISSNVVTLTLVDPVVYNLSITSSGNQCDRDNLWVRATWSPIAGASTYTITGTEDSTSANTRYTIGGRSYLYSFANGTTAFTQNADYSYSVVAKANGVAIAPPSPTITIKTPRQDASLCIGSSILLEIRKNTQDNSGVYSSSATLNKGEFFDLRWTVTNPVGTYMNTHTITAPGGADASTMWSWGNNVSGDNKKISTDKAGIVSGNYIFSMRYDDYFGTGNPSLSSNQVTLTMITPPEDMCININGFQDSIPPGMVEYSPKICHFAGNPVPPNPPDLCPNIDGVQNPIPDGLILKANGNCGRLGGGGIEGPDINIKLFLGDSTVISKVLSDNPSTAIYRVNKGNNFNIAWRSNLPNNYKCKPQTRKESGELVDIFPWNTSDSITGNNSNISTAAAEITTYDFYLACNDPTNSPLGVLRSNVVQMEVSPIVVNANSVKLWIGNPGILNNDINTPAPNFGYTYKVKKGETFNLKWASNLGNGFECTPETRKDGQNIATWDWNSTRSKGDRTLGLTTTNVEKGLYTFQLRCSDPSVIPPVASIPSNLVKLQVIESTIIEQ